jgi:hypothetical protein
MFSNKSDNVTTPSILLIVVFFGKWPDWFPAFIVSCRANSTINWLIFTDCDGPQYAPPNVRFLKSSREEIRELTEKRLNMQVALPNNRKLCDLRPAYGVVFSEYIEHYDFWGYCDIDVIWGDIRSFYDTVILQGHDVISARQNRLAGHFSLLRNTPEINLAFLNHPQLEEIMKSPDYRWFDEQGFSDLIASKFTETGLRVLWDKYRVNFVNPMDNYPSILSWIDRFQWRNGKLYSWFEQDSEIMYLHFMNWKDTLQWCCPKIGQNIKSFKISFSSIETESDSPPFSYRFKSRCKSLMKPKYYLLYVIRSARRIINPKL